MAGLPDLLTVEEAARLIRVGRTKAYAMAQEWLASELHGAALLSPRLRPFGLARFTLYARRRRSASGNIVELRSALSARSR